MGDGPADVLLVEDSATCEELVLYTLNKAGRAYRVDVVRDGAEALDYMFCRGAYAERSLRHCPKVILLDLDLPKLNGKEVLRQIREHERTKMVPVVMLTSSTEERDIERCYELGANSYIVKPVCFEQFSETVEQIGIYWGGLNRTSFE
jgi:DNA-binding response OmpR family regulator